MFYFILEKSCFGLIFVREDGNISPGGGGGRMSEQIPPAPYPGPAVSLPDREGFK